MDWDHHWPPSPPPFMLLQIEHLWEVLGKPDETFHLSSPLRGVPRVPEVTGDHDGHYPSGDRAGTVRELPMKGGKAGQHPRVWGGTGVMGKDLSVWN